MNEVIKYSVASVESTGSIRIIVYNYSIHLSCINVQLIR